MLSRPTSRAADPASRSPVAPAVAASARRAHWCREQSCIEHCAPNRLTTQLRNVAGETDFGKQAADRRAQPAGRLFVVRGVSQDLTYFLFHTAPVAPRPALQNDFHLLFDVPYRLPGANDSMISSRCAGELRGIRRRAAEGLSAISARSVLRCYLPAQPAR